MHRVPPWKLHITVSAAHLLPLGLSWSSKSFSLISSALLSLGLRHPESYLLRLTKMTQQISFSPRGKLVLVTEVSNFLCLLPLSFFFFFFLDYMLLRPRTVSVLLIPVFSTLCLGHSSGKTLLNKYMNKCKGTSTTDGSDWRLWPCDIFNQ